ncbi:MAG: NAD(P)/FAD-dependent oxidoreductase [Actinobacteria bacterium]|nr:NAD(P)/FAD-dependent oxidoreductase [Actinomycetota bacterium]
MTEYDVLVLGGGLSGGLPAAAYLQKAGARVAIVEQGVDAGRFYLSYELYPGVRFDHSPVNFSGLSPAIGDLDLESHGYALAPPPVTLAAMDGRGNSAVFYPDMARTCAELARYSPADADTFGALLGRLFAQAPALLKAAFYTPHPDAAAYSEAVQMTAEVLQMTEADLLRTTGPELLESLFESDEVRRFVTALPALNLFGDLLQPGQGALAWAWSLMLRAAVAPGGNQSLVKALERSFVASEGTLLRNTVVHDILVEGGRCVGATVTPFGTTDVVTLRARGAVISNLGAPLTGRLLGSHAWPALSGWKSDNRVLTVQDLVLRRPLDLPEDVAAAPRVYLVWDSWDECVNWLAQSRTDSAETYFGDIELTQFHRIYPGAPNRFGLRVRYGTGPYIDDAWDARKGPFAERMRGILGALDPELDAIVEYEHTASPLDFWRSNPAATHGNPIGGDFVGGQWIEDRLPYRSPVPQLYLSNAVWPPALSWLAAGYNVACVVAEDLGIREQPWWHHQPGSWFAARAAAAESA